MLWGEGDQIWVGAFAVYAVGLLCVTCHAVVCSCFMGKIYILYIYIYIEYRFIIYIKFNLWYIFLYLSLKWKKNALSTKGN